MLRKVRSWLATRFGRENSAADRESEEAADRESEDEGGFLRSRLDASVLTAHGMGTGTVEHEVADVEEQAQHLEEEHARHFEEQHREK